MHRRGRLTPGARARPSALALAIVLAGAAAAAACTRDSEGRAPSASDSAALATPAPGDSVPATGCDAIATGRITSKGVGPLALGQRIAVARTSCALRDTGIVLSEGMRERAHVVPGAPVIALSTGTRDTSVIRVIVRGDGPRTAAGIGVGSPVRELRVAYDSACVMQGEGRSVVVTPSLAGVSFAIDRPRPPSITRGAMRSSANLAPWDSAHVSEIWVHGNIVVGCRPA